MPPCARARRVPPAIFPAATANGETGETTTACRNPSRRSSMTEIVEKIAAKRTTRTTVPGKK